MDGLNKIFLTILTVVGLATIGLQVPAIQEQRAVASDQQTVSDLQDVATAIDTYLSSEHGLPSSLQVLSIETDAKGRLDKYQYKAGSGNSYELCATFKTDTTKSEITNGSSTATDYIASYNSFGQHPKGRHCFTQQSLFGGAGSLDFNYGNDSGSNGSSAKDLEILTDINGIHSHLEVYYVSNGTYPSLSQFQSASWRTTNMPDISSDFLEGPSGETIGSGYMYSPSPVGCESDCTSYTLSATYSDGTVYTKQSL